jgi:type II secretion system protein N
MMKLSRNLLFYVLYAFAALFFFLYFRFPSELIEEILSRRIEQAQPEASLSTDVIRLTIPPGIKLEPLSVSYAGIPLLHMDKFKISPRLFSLIGNHKRYGLHGVMGDGELKGEADTISAENSQQTQITLNLSRVPLEFLEILSQYPGFKPDGEMDARINFDSTRAGGTAEVNLEIFPAQLSLDPPLMGIETIEFTQIKAQMTVTQRMVQIRGCDATGDQLEGKITGSIVFRNPIGDSRITLSVTLKPQPAFLAEHKNDMIGGLLASSNTQLRGLIFRISGTLNNPNYVIR